MTFPRKVKSGCCREMALCGEMVVQARSFHYFTYSPEENSQPTRGEQGAVWIPRPRPPVCQLIHVSKCHLHSWKIILSRYVAMIVQMGDSWSPNLKFAKLNKST